MLQTWRGSIDIRDVLEEKSTVAAGLAKGARERVLARLAFIQFSGQHQSAYLALTRKIGFEEYCTPRIRRPCGPSPQSPTVSSLGRCRDIGN